MIVLSRKEEEALRIGDLELIVVSITPNSVKLGIKAGPEVIIHRNEFRDHLLNLSFSEVKKLFQKYLKAGKYDAAKCLLYVTDKYQPTNKEYNQLLAGLEQKGLLNDKIREYLGKYNVSK